jgi:hypothetical protein
MPTNFVRRPAAATPAISSAGSLNPLVIVATILVIVLHFMAAATLERSHARPGFGPVIDTIEEDVSCPAKVEGPTSALPFD